VAGEKTSRRPGKNLIVRIDAGLDATTSTLSWRLTSLDPTTLQPPTDPEAGFLPPDQNPPEGDGDVVFTVERGTSQKGHVLGGPVVVDVVAP